MSTVSGLKHVATEPTQLDAKRERRRGTSGRAAALRRAPSDSDCSGETASLSADSGDRSVRPPAPPPRTTKTRSRRRGSEWEVLEGLKDGQRFEKRPEVFNGYLHKKRKWPLKGWHKRYFVVDGGILVYARSPTDVARGRLHGSVDVGLSVISAKARRRRIDIDADEFIYHLRAKTPDVFRTWLNVLKTHRLYRQHLLTFGARESAPKIHAPLDDVPPTENSSRTTSNSSHIQDIPGFPTYYNPRQSPIFSSSTSCGSEPLSYISSEQSFATDVNYYVNNRGVYATNYSKDESMFVSLCSWNSDTEKLKVDFTNQLSKHFDAAPTGSAKRTAGNRDKHNIKTGFKDKFITNKVPKSIHYLERKNALDTGNSPTYFSFLRKRNDCSLSQPVIRKSKKSTNVVKYKNKFDEPLLNRPLYDEMVLGKCKSKDSKTTCMNVENKNNAAFPSPRHADTLKLKCKSEYDTLIEELMLSIFERSVTKIKQFKSHTMKSYLIKIIDELYCMKLNSKYDNTVKDLFRYLLEFWLINTMSEFKDSMVESKHVDVQSRELFMTDNTTSNVYIPLVTVSTQFGEINNSPEDKKSNALCPTAAKRKRNVNRLSETINSFVKEKRIQDLEEILWNTVYVCETMRSDHSKEKDIMITKKLIDSFDSADKRKIKNGNKTASINSESSNELSQIKDTLDHLICETSIPPDLAKDFLRLYLDLLLDQSASESASLTGESDSNNRKYECDVQTESINRKASISISTKEFADQNKISNDEKCDSSEVYIQKLLQEISNVDVESEPNFQLKCESSNLSNKNKINKEVKSYNKKPYQYNSQLEIVYSKNIIKNEENVLKCKSRENISKKYLSNAFSNNDSNYAAGFGTRSFEKSNYIDSIDLKSFDHKKCNLEKEHVTEEIKSNLENNNKSSKHICNEINLNVLNNRNTRSAVCVDDSRSCYIYTIKDNDLKKTPKLNYVPQTQKNISKSPNPINQTIPNHMEELSVFDNTPKVVDEKFVLLQLEHITVVSKHLPCIHKDINSLFVKLRKKYEKNINSKVRGLSLLGKIYNEDSKTRDNETQYNEYTRPSYIISKEQYTSTYTALNNKSTSTNNCNEKYFDVEKIENDNIILNDSSLYYDDVEDIPMTEAQTTSRINVSRTDLTRADKAVSNQNFHRETRPCSCSDSVGTFVHYLLYTKRLQSLNMPTSATILDKGNNKNKKFRQGRNRTTTENLLKGTKLSTSLKVSTLSQTDDRVCYSRTTLANKDRNVYRLFLSNKYVGKKTNSMINLNEKTKSEDELRMLYRCSSDSYGVVSPAAAGARGPLASLVSGTPGGRLAGWIIESGGPLDNASRELGQAQLSVQQLQRLLDALELQQQAHHDTDVSLEGASPNVKKDRRKFGLRKKKSSNKCASVELAPPQLDASTSHTAISALTAPPSPGGGGACSAPSSAASLPIACAATRPQSLPGAEALNAPASLTSLTPDHQLREDFTVLAKDVVSSLKTIVATLVCERARLRAAVEDGPTQPGGVLTALRTSLASALQQNSELRSRLARIHDASDLVDVSSLGHNSEQNRRFPHSLSYSSSCVSASEFFDAEEHDEGDVKTQRIPDAEETGVIELDGDSSSEAGSLSSEDGSASSDNSDAVTRVEDRAAPEGVGRASGGGGDEGGTVASRTAAAWTRRTRLPHPRPSPAPPSLWNLLYKNIGKDLSQISMPVTINEPLNMLQRLCEELEYSELLDAAASCARADERCALVAAFAVSAYAATAHRAASKPFNPLLAETYECVRADRGFNFLAEQVSHHPPISACHAESPRWVFWQEARIKTKFWGKSMEFQPAGRVHVRLLTTGDHYSWNKVTTCVHNLFGGQRWVDQYGEMQVTCHGSDVSCTLNFIKASSWSNSRHEVRGSVAGAGGARLRLQGRWTEALHAGDPPAARCLWRPGAMPAEHEEYYGFTRFAMELNELEPGMKEVLPYTDTRLRPDQRALEEGDVDSAEQLKHDLEQAQRERRRSSPEHTPAWFRKATEEGSGGETWVFTGEYWRARDAGFPGLRAPRLW